MTGDTQFKTALWRCLVACSLAGVVAGFVLVERMSFMERCTASHSFAACGLMRATAWELP